MRKVLSSDGNRVETFHYDAHDGEAFISSQTDVTQLLEANKFQRNNAPATHKSETFNKVASIDTDAALQWCRVNGIKFGEFLGNPAVLKRFLNDPDNVAWRTRPGKI